MSELNEAIEREEVAAMETPIIEEVLEQLKTLPRELQWRVLEFSRALAKSTSPSGVSGQQLLRFAGAIPLDDVRVISAAIEQGCERVDANEW